MCPARTAGHVHETTKHHGARVIHGDRDYGSIAVGKVADLVIVDGKPATRIRDLRRTELVVRAGRVYGTRDLYAVAGLTPRWK